jgi:serine/threonine protein kinase/tetratricopeptide (TPR) repeat protein
MTAHKVPSSLPLDPGESYNPTKSSFRIPSSQGPGESAETIADAMMQNAEALPVVDEEEQYEAMRRSPFRLDQMIGSGGFGEVWRGVQRSLGRVVAVKRLRQDILRRASQDPETYAKLDIAFLQESLTAAALDHPNILPIHELGRDGDGLPQLAMKLVRGQVWESLIYYDRDLSFPDFLDRHLPIFVSVCQAVAFTHSRGIIHRDIKPSQVMVGDFGEVLLMDWGLAMIYDEEVAKETLAELLATRIAATRETSVNPAGTPSYMAPEQTDPECTRLAAETDIYLLGGVLYYLLTGEVPHRGDDTQVAYLCAMMGEVQPPSERAPSRKIPPDLEELAMRCLEAEPRDRPHSVIEIIVGIKDHITGAGKRRESETLVSEVAARFESEEHTYPVLAQCNSALARAEGLWPGNPKVAHLRDRIQLRFARLALQNGDINLARLFCETISSPTIVQTIRAEAAAAEARTDRTGRQRKILAVSTIVLLAIISLLAGGAAKRAIEAQEARTALADSLDGAESFMNFTLLELRGGLGELGRLDLLERTAERARDYYSALPEAEPTNSALHQRVLAFRTIGDIFGKRGRFEDARGAYEQSRDYARELAQSSPVSPQWLQEYATSLEICADVFERLAMYPEALDDLDSAAREYTALGEETPGIATLHGVNLVWQGRLQYRLGKEDSARENWQEALRLLAPVVAIPDTASPAAKAAAAVAFMRLGDIESARPLVAELLAAGWNEPEFLSLCLKHGLLN